MQFDQFKRREVITLLGGALAGWPLAARAQQASSVPKVSLLNPGPSAMARVRSDYPLDGLRSEGFGDPNQLGNLVINTFLPQ
jgi:hypothetical protein